MNIPEQKICSHCLLSKPAKAFSRAKHSKDGLHYLCRECRSKLRKAKHTAWREAAPQYKVGNKTCSRCHETKNLTEFRLHPDGKDGVFSICRICEQGISTDYHETHKIEEEAYRVVYYSLHAERYQAHARNSYNSLSEEEKKALNQARAPYQADYQSRNRESLRIKKASYYQENTEMFIVYNQRRRARKRSLPNTWTLEQQEFMHSYWHRSCAACGNQEGFFWILAHDHWEPLSSPNCPGTVATNMLPLCHGDGGCNNSKHDKDPHSWLISRFGKSKAAKIEKAIATYFAIVAERFGTVSAPTERSL